MSKYDNLFDETLPTKSIFADKHALDPLQESENIVARDEQERAIARILNGVNEGFLPTTVTLYGPPGTGKTVTTRRLCREFDARTDEFAFEYVNLKECRSLFSAANEIHVELTGEQKASSEGLDGVFAGIWTALESYPEYVVLILDEIDHVSADSNYDPNDFFYRLIRGEGRQQRDLTLSLFLVSNELLEVDLRLDSRVESAMSGEEVFFPPYGTDLLTQILTPRLERAFHDEALQDEIVRYGIRQAATRWGDVRKALRLFRHAGEMANECDLDTLTRECIDQNLEAAEKDTIVDKLLQLPAQHFLVLRAITGWTGDSQETVMQPVTMEKVSQSYEALVAEDSQIGDRALRSVVTDLTTMGLVETWIKSKGRGGRIKQIETTFEATWIHDVHDRYVEQSADVDAG